MGAKLQCVPATSLNKPVGAGNSGLMRAVGQVYRLLTQEAGTAGVESA
jgi:hypothetical protein